VPVYSARFEDSRTCRAAVDFDSRRVRSQNGRARIAYHVLRSDRTREMPEGCPRHFGAMPHGIVVMRGSRQAGASESPRGNGRPYAPLIVSIATTGLSIVATARGTARDRCANRG
jgi:hypothetical protein